MSNFLTFIWAVITSWVGLVGAASIFSVIIQYLLKIYILPSAWIALGAILLFVSSYEAWLDKHASYMAERCKIEKYEDRSAAKNQLAAFRKEADDLMSALTKDSSPEEVKAWFSRENDWEWKVYPWTRDNLGEAAAGKVLDKNGIPGASWSNQISPEHNHELGVINRIKQNIDALMESSTWDDFDVRIAQSIDACKVNN
jgi:hypothetical protein